MNRLTTDTPHGNFETIMNFAYAKNGEVWLRGADDGKDAELCAYIAKRAFYLELCGITNKDDVIEACGAADCFCELGALFAAATQAAELRARLAAYEGTGLEPEEIKRSDALLRGFIDLSRRHAKPLPWIERVMIADREGRLVVLPCGDDVTLEYNGLLYKGDHWNPPTLTAFASDPSTRSGLRVHCFGIEEAEKALEGMNNDVR